MSRERGRRRKDSVPHLPAMRSWLCSRSSNSSSITNALAANVVARRLTTPLTSTMRKPSSTSTTGCYTNAGMMTAQSSLRLKWPRSKGRREHSRTGSGRSMRTSI
jgi:hypothetical protein